MMKISTLHFNTKVFNPDRTIQHFSTPGKPVDDEGCKAPDRCIENIMSFARSYRVEETKAAGKVEMILN
jgi:hypothetical protein